MRKALGWWLAVATTGAVASAAMPGQALSGSRGDRDNAGEAADAAGAMADADAQPPIIVTGNALPQTPYCAMSRASSSSAAWTAVRPIPRPRA